MTGWHLCGGTENRCISVLPPRRARRTRRLHPDTGARLERPGWCRRSPARCGRRAQLVRVERRAEALFGGFDFGEVVEAEAELREFGRRDAGQRIAGLSARSCPPATSAVATIASAQMPAADRRRVQDVHGWRSPARSRTISTPRMKLCPAPHIRRALEGVAARLRARGTATTISPRPRFGITTLTVVPAIRNPCAVSSLLMRSSTSSPASTTISEGVNAKRSARDLDDARAATCVGHAPRDATSTRRRPGTDRRPHQNHHPSPTLKLFGALITELWLRCHT